MAWAAASPSGDSRAAALARLETRIGAELAAGRTPAAVAAAESSLALRRTRDRGRPLAQAAALDTLGLRFFMAGEPAAWEAAARFFGRALALRERELGPAHLEVARTLATLATLEDYQGRWSEALVHQQRALAIQLRELGERDAAVAASRRQLGMLYAQLGRYEDAQPPLEQSLARYDSLGPAYAAKVVDGLNNLGEVTRIQDKYRESESYFRRGLEVARSRLPADDPLRAALLNNLAGVYKDLARYDDAEPLLIQALAFRDSAAAPDSVALADAHLNLAEVYRLQGRTDEAAPHYERALAIARQAFGADHPELVPFLNQLAVLHRERGEFELAEPLFRESLALLERTLGADHPLLAQSQHDLAELLERRAKFSEAEQMYRRALAIRERRLGANHPEAAITRVDLARCLSRDPAAGDAAALPELERAIATLDSSRAYPETRLDAYALRAELRERRGEPAAAIADLVVALDAVDALRPGRGGGEQTRAGFMAQNLDRFDRMVRLRLASGDLPAAIETHERARARVLLEQIASGGVDLRAGIAPATLEPLEARETAARVRLAHHQRAIQALEQQTDLTEGARLEGLAESTAARDSAAWNLQQALEAIRRASPIWRELLSSGGRPASLAEIQAELARTGTWMLEYHLGERDGWVFAIAPRAGEALALPLRVDAAAAATLGVSEGPATAAVLERIIDGAHGRAVPGSRVGLAELLSGKREGDRSFRLSQDPGGPDPLELRLHALWRVLVPDTLWKLVRNVSEVVVVPDGALHLLPFEALVVQPRTPRSAVRYWLDAGPALDYGASATSLIGLERRARAAAADAAGAPRLLSVTDPVFDPAEAAGAGRGRAATSAGSTRWSRLPGTRLETEAVRRAFAPERIEVLQGLEAVEPRVRGALAGRRYLHFATHGFVTESSSDLLAGLVLTPPRAPTNRSEDDGLFQLFEIYETKLDCELAVLSACETQRGTSVAGEGVFALSRGFLAAGARRVVASLWAVSDASTADLMGDFFRGIARGERRATDFRYAAALRDAKRRLRSQPRWSDPFYWAPFVISGELSAAQR